MSRPGYALSLLLVVFAGSMMLVQAAHGQSILDARLGYARYQLCPLLGDQMVSCGYGPLATPLGLAEAPSRYALGACSQCRFSPAETVAEASGPQREQLLSGHDANYDQVVYGAEGTKDAENADPLGYVFFIPDAAPEHLLPQPESFEIRTAAHAVLERVEQLLTYGRRDACWPVPPLAAAASPTPANLAWALDTEPKSIDDYFVMFGGADEVHAAQQAVAAWQEKRQAEARAAAFAALVRLPGAVRDHYWNASELAMWRCELNDMSYRLRASWRDAATRLALARPYQQWVAAGRPAVADQALPAAASFANVDEAARADTDAQQLRNASQLLGRLVLKSLAHSLDRTGRVLQNASREIHGLLENQTSPVSLSNELTD